jgi:hypothetical protein
VRLFPSRWIVRSSFARPQFRAWDTVALNFSFLLNRRALPSLIRSIRDLDAFQALLA